MHFGFGTRILKLPLCGHCVGAICPTIFGRRFRCDCLLVRRFETLETATTPQNHTDSIAAITNVTAWKLVLSNRHSQDDDVRNEQVIIERITALAPHASTSENGRSVGETTLSSTPE